MASDEAMLISHNSMQTDENMTHWASIGLNFALTVVCIYPTWLVISELDKTHEVVVLDHGAEGTAAKDISTGDDDAKL